MSADIILYKLSDAKVQLKGLYAIPLREWDNIPYNEYDALIENAEADCFEDGVAHELIDLTRYKWYFGDSRGWKRVRNKFNKLPIRSGKLDATGNIHKYVVADTVYWYSTWHVLNRRYYKKDTWLALCTTKEEVVRFFAKYGNKKFDNATWTLNDILERWDDKSFLIISY